MDTGASSALVFWESVTVKDVALTADERHVMRVLYDRGPTSERAREAWLPVGVGDDEAPAILRSLGERGLVEVAWVGPTRTYALTSAGEQVAAQERSS